MVNRADLSTTELVKNFQQLKRMSQPEEISALIAFLLGDESKFITGAAISIDGGWTA